MINKENIKKHLLKVSENMETWQLVNYFYDKYLDEITNDFLLKSDRNCSVEERLYPEIKINYLLENRFELMVENTHLKSNKEKIE